MKASPSDQRQILDIQNFDFSVATLKNKAANLPETMHATYALPLKLKQVMYSANLRAQKAM
jgi:hypothetical protein